MKASVVIELVVGANIQLVCVCVCVCVCACACTCDGIFVCPFCNYNDIVCYSYSTGAGIHGSKPPE